MKFKLGLCQIGGSMDKEEARKVLAELIGPDTAFLFKASRGMALEELCAFVRDFGGGK